MSRAIRHTKCAHSSAGWTLAVAGCLLISACSGETDVPAAEEQISARPLRLLIEARGELRAVKSMPLTVPGEGWARRQIVWMVEDGSWVKAGDLVARFSAAGSELALHQAELDLEKNALSFAAKDDELAAVAGRVAADIADVDTKLEIARRYAGAELAMLARHQVLDAVQDQAFLGIKRDVLDWKLDQSGARGKAELGVLESQKAGFNLSAELRRKDLDALELRAANSGVVVLTADWSGEKARLGAMTWAGQEFAALPDASSLEVELKLPQIEAQGLKVGQQVEMFPLGRPEQVVSGKLNWVASAPQQRARRNPVKTIAVRAAVSADDAKRFSWVPGQAFVGRIVLLDAEEAISVPNLSVIDEGERRFVEVVDGDSVERREVEIGVRGPGRSEVLKGLDGGERIRVLPKRKAVDA